jgi:hypothetical protein
MSAKDEEATKLASALFAGINALAFLRGLRFAPSPAEAANIDLAELRATLAEMVEVLRPPKVGPGVGPFSVEAIRHLGEVLVALDGILPGTLPTTALFDLVDRVWSEMGLEESAQPKP